MRTTMLRCVGVLLAMLVPAVSARAAGWERLPNGEWGFTTELTTSGLFTCLSAEYYIAGGSCSANGNTLVLTSGQSTMTVQFTGLTRSILATNVRSDPFALGTLTKTFTGDPFTIPLMKSQHAELFRFSILLSSPTGIQSSLSAGYTALDRTYLPYNCCDYYSTYARVGIPGQPAGLGY
ncbi:MAG TPA: hypothetical protein VE861_10930, partial [Gemmatimonadaceae bacterium]|nr:hypothetical protein [Gemmatimonadaceae bacterium]